MTINVIHELQALNYSINTDNGWYDATRPFDADIALLHSEVSEAYEAYRNHRMEMTYSHKDGKPEGMPSEIADIFIRLLDTCQRYEIDLELVTRDKLAYNKTRGYRHGGKYV